MKMNNIFAALEKAKAMRLRLQRMQTICALRVKIYQPNAHFRLPFSYQRRLTYPLPPYSTVIGFISNVLGVGYDLECKFGEKIKHTKLGISGYFDSKVTESIWFRNMNTKAHEKRFSEINSRFINGSLEHIGGQSLMSIDVLNDAHFVFHLYHEDKEFLKILKQNIENPKNRLDILHLGRAEDWIVIENIDFIDLGISQSDGNYNRFFWIPEKAFPTVGENNSNFEHINGLSYRLPTFCHIHEYQATQNMNEKREFEYMTTKLNDGAIMNNFYWYDEKEKTPVFLADFN